MGKQTLLPPCHWLSSSLGSIETESHSQLMNACQGTRHWSQSSYEETDVHITAAPVTTTANQQPPPRGEDFLAMKKNPSAQRYEYFWDHLLHCLVPSTEQSQQLVSFKSMLASHHHNVTRILRITTFCWEPALAGARGVQRSPAWFGEKHIISRTFSLPLSTDAIFMEKSQNPLNHGLSTRLEIFRLQGLQ